MEFNRENCNYLWFAIYGVISSYCMYTYSLCTYTRLVACIGQYLAWQNDYVVHYFFCYQVRLWVSLSLSLFD